MSFDQLCVAPNIFTLKLKPFTGPPREVKMALHFRNTEGPCLMRLFWSRENLALAKIRISQIFVPHAGQIDSMRPELQSQNNIDVCYVKPFYLGA